MSEISFLIRSHLYDLSVLISSFVLGLSKQFWYESIFGFGIIVRGVKKSYYKNMVSGVLDVGEQGPPISCCFSLKSSKSVLDTVL